MPPFEVCTIYDTKNRKVLQKTTFSSEVRKNTSFRACELPTPRRPEVLSSQRLAAEIVTLKDLPASFRELDQTPHLMEKHQTHHRPADLDHNLFDE